MSVALHFCEVSCNNATSYCGSKILYLANLVLNMISQDCFIEFAPLSFHPLQNMGHSNRKQSGSLYFVKTEVFLALLPLQWFCKRDWNLLPWPFVFFWFLPLQRWFCDRCAAWLAPGRLRTSLIVLLLLGIADCNTITAMVNWLHFVQKMLLFISPSSCC